MPQRRGRGIADVETRSLDVRGISRRRKAVADSLLRQTEQLVEASRACLARSRETLERVASLERPWHARRER